MDAKLISLLETIGVEEGVRALVEYIHKKEGSVSLLNETQNIHLQLTFKKVPDVANKIIRICLPTSLQTDTREVCLFVKDLDRKSRDYEVTVRHFRELLDKNEVKGISEIISLKELKIEYSTFEAKKNLSNMYDIYLADESIIGILLPLLGKHFIKKKRHPVQVNLKAKDVKEEFHRALSISQCILGGRGSTCTVSVAHNGMTEEQISQNIIAAAKRLSETIPGGAVNIRNLHIKTALSPAILIYVSLGSSDEVTLPVTKVEVPLDDPEDVTTVMGAKVRVLPGGEIQIIPDPKED
ncbi:hypothetical protein LSAT2_017818 [Lamellibrachia satsuma]|nr:hypothetical protein LSAT2_017818 [Lamellibrachia satsuma]